MVLLLNGGLCDNVRHDADNDGDEGVKVMIIQMTMMRIASEIECSESHALNLPPVNYLISCNAFKSFSREYGQRKFNFHRYLVDLDFTFTVIWLT